MKILASAVFVVIWSTGFIVGRAVSDAPQSFLFIRFLAAAIVLSILAEVIRRFGPRSLRSLTGTRQRRNVWVLLAIGALSNGVYLCLSYLAIAQGFPAGIMALVGGWQPVLTIVVTALLVRRRPDHAVTIGIGVSLFGIACVLLPGIIGSGATVTPWHLILAFASVTALTCATMWQKKVADYPLIPALAWQALGGAAVAFVAAIVTGEGAVAVDVRFVFALVWSVLGISVIGLMIMVYLVRVRSATYVSALILASPPLAVVEAWLMFGEALDGVQWIGVFVTLIGVGLVILVPSGSDPGGSEPSDSGPGGSDR